MVRGFDGCELWFGWLFCDSGGFLVVGFGLLLVFWWQGALMCGWFVVGFRGFFLKVLWPMVVFGSGGGFQYGVEL